jgi:small-conductance mechanosensitive channel
MAEIINSTWVHIIIQIIITVAISIAATNLINRTLNESRFGNMIHIKFLKNIVVAIVWIVAITTVASQFSGFTKLANTILAGSGIIAVVIGLAAQESFANLLSGLFISFFKPFNIGDRIRIVGDDTAGYVEDITLRHTIIRTYTNVRIIVPNSIMGSSKIENSTFSKGASYPIEVDIAYESIDKQQRAIEIMEEVVTNHPKFYDRRSEIEIKQGIKPVSALCTELGASGIHLKVLMWTEEFGDNAQACSDCRLEIVKRFNKEDIEITYNKLVVIQN